jgi:hypothetical protein
MNKSKTPLRYIAHFYEHNYSSYNASLEDSYDNARRAAKDYYGEVLVEFAEELQVYHPIKGENYKNKVAKTYKKEEEE